MHLQSIKVALHQGKTKFIHSMGKKQTDAELRRTALVFLFLEGGGGGNDVLKFCSVGGHNKRDFVSLTKYT